MAEKDNRSPEAIRQQARRDRIKEAGLKWVRLLVHDSWEMHLKSEVEPKCQEPKKPDKKMK